MVYFRTCAYNAEKTIKRAIESVLNQEGLDDFRYYILDNGSTDSTGEIIREYAQKDSRIVAFYNVVNRKLEENPDFWNIIYCINSDDEFIMLDADDYYENNFYSLMHQFRVEHNLDVAACGTIFEREDGTKVGERVLPIDLIQCSSETVADYFAIMYWNMRQVWGKIYTGEVIKYRFEIDKPEEWPKAYGGDTVNVLNVLINSQSFGVKAMPLHHYQVSKKSVSYSWIEGREEADKIVLSWGLKYLASKLGTVDNHNFDFLLEVFANAICDTFDVLLNAKNISVEKKIDILHTIVKQDEFDIAKERVIGESDVTHRYKKSCNDIYAFISSHTNDLVDGTVIALILQKIYTKELELIPNEIIVKVLTNYPAVISQIRDEKWGMLLGTVDEYIKKTERKKDLSSVDFVLGQNVAAILNLEEEYVRYTKLYIKQLITEQKIDEAITELQEWIKILPGDKELLAICEKIEQIGA